MTAVYIPLITPPTLDAPTGLTLTWTTDGRLKITLVQPVQTTHRYTFVLLDLGASPDFLDPIIVVIPQGQTTATVSGLPSNTLVTARAYAADSWGGVSVNTADASVTTGARFGLEVALELNFDGGGSPIVPVTSELEVIFPLGSKYTILGYSLVANVSGSIVIDLWVKNGVPTVADTIIGGGGTKPTLATAQYQDAGSIAGWATTVIDATATRKTLKAHVDSVTTIGRACLMLHLRRDY